MDKLTVGNVSVDRSQHPQGIIQRGTIPVGTSMGGAPQDIPITVYHGAQDGPVLWLNGATHGDEPEGPFSIFLATQTIDVSTLKGTVVAVPVMNVGAFTAGTRGDPLDTFSYDMNRVYPGREGGYPTERAAFAHFTAMKDTCDLQIAIHSGGEHSYLAHMIFASDNVASMELAAAMGQNWHLVFASPTGGGNPSAQMGKLGKGGITVELGGNCRTLTKDFHAIAQDLADSYLNVMRHYQMISGEAHYCSEWKQGHQIALLAPETGMFVGNAELPFETVIAQDTPLGNIYNLYGDVIAEVRAPQDGVVFGLRSRPSVLAGQWCCFFGVIDAVVDDLLTRKDS